jgi:hypothetical protein
VDLIPFIFRFQKVGGHGTAAQRSSSCWMEKRCSALFCFWFAAIEHSAARPCGFSRRESWWFSSSYDTHERTNGRRRRRKKNKNKTENPERREREKGGVE